MARTKINGVAIATLVTCSLFLSVSTFTHAKHPDENKLHPKLKKALENKSESWVYFVQMDLDPAVLYEGHLSGFKATKPKQGKRFDSKNEDVKKYRKHLKSKHDGALQGAGVRADKKIHDFSVALNGFTAKLSKDQATKLAKQPGVVKVRPDIIRYKTSENRSVSLGFSDAAGSWIRGATGEDVVVGIIDTGIWPEHPSFADDGSYGPSPVGVLDETRPSCHFGNAAHNEKDAVFQCNNKLLGARQMLDTYREFVGIEASEFDSARDDDGHGTHTGSTAAGNAGVAASIFGIPRGTVSGVAPRARIIAYKGLGLFGGFGSDLAAAIDQAVADGVDVINYSVGGGPSLEGPDDIAFLFAADAGVFVATSAGNDGPDPGTIGGPASVPWLTSVGASSGDQAFISEISLSGPGKAPEKLWGGSVTNGIENYNLVDADTVGDGSNGECLLPFPPGTFKANDAVLCNRYDFGVARTRRASNVAEGGAGAVLLHNVSAAHPNMTPTDNHPLPTVHMLKDVGQPLKDYLMSHTGQVQISFTQGETRNAREDSRVKTYMASFSSQGPDSVALDIIKPDVTAPGINILAGASPVHNGSAAQGESFQAIMGTSMSSPYVAGLFALIKQARPDWSPAVAKSALMTTAHQKVVKRDYTTAADPFDFGAGHVNTSAKANKDSMFEPGLAYDAGLYDYLGFMCDASPSVFSDPAGTCGLFAALGIQTEAYNLNLPSIGVAELAGKQVVMRTVTSVANESGCRTYEVDVDEPPGFDITVTPKKFTLQQGEAVTYQVIISNKNAPIGEWRFGSLTWEDHELDEDDANAPQCNPAVAGNRNRRESYRHYEVRSPIAVRATLFSSPSQVDLSGVDGSGDFTVRFGYTGNYLAAAHGLEPAVVTSDNVLQDPDQDFDPTDGFSNEHQFDVSNAALLRIAMPPDSVASPDTDLDIFVFDPNGNFVAASFKAGTDELIDIKQPINGTWTVYVHGWQTIGGSSDYQMYSWLIPATPGGNLVINSAPNAAMLGEDAALVFSWTNAAAGQWHLGALSHSGNNGVMGYTLVNVDNR
ncbi:MAG: S8 family serine peptidase [Gammaproteobacteria bacterium]|nr:S8 family serine peptidase [Gammaproteobacteria bacterium]MDH5801584.1 S8 family serine peptidase [Gammaproteobacteria bacterium]